MIICQAISDPKKGNKRYYAVVNVRKTFNHTGDNGEGVPPVHIPNTEVKTFSAKSTWLGTAREDRTLPGPSKEEVPSSFFYILLKKILVFTSILQCDKIIFR